MIQLTDSAIFGNDCTFQGLHVSRDLGEHVGFYFQFLLCVRQHLEGTLQSTIAYKLPNIKSGTLNYRCDKENCIFFFSRNRNILHFLKLRNIPFICLLVTCGGGLEICPGVVEVPLHLFNGERCRLHSHIGHVESSTDTSRYYTAFSQGFYNPVWLESIWIDTQKWLRDLWELRCEWLVCWISYFLKII